MNSVEDKTSALLAALWIRSRPIIEQRVDLLDRAASAAAANTLDEDSREEAADVAHQLAGSLGMYGYDHGTRLARQLELLLDYATPDPGKLRSLVSQLKETLTLPQSPTY